MNTLETVKSLCSALENKKAPQVSLFDLEGRNPFVDYVVLVLCKNPIHCRALAKEVQDQIVASRETLNDDFYAKARITGSVESGWLIVDLNAVIVHILLEELNDYYQLETLFKSPPILYHTST